jgi:hypothetical protein
MLAQGPHNAFAVAIGIEHGDEALAEPFGDKAFLNDLFCECVQSSSSADWALIPTPAIQ